MSQNTRGGGNSYIEGHLLEQVLRQHLPPLPYCAFIIC